MATSVFYADARTGAIMISNVINPPDYENLLQDPVNNLEDIRFHSSLPFLTIKQSLEVSSVTFPGFARDTYSVSSGGDCLNSGTTYTTIAPTTRIQKVLVGTSTVTNPSFVLLEYNGIIYSGTYDGLTTTDVDRNVYCLYDVSDNNIYLVAITTAVSADATSQTLYNVKVHVTNG